MIFLIPVPAIVGAAATYYLGKYAFVECAAQGRAITAPDPQSVEATTAGAAAAALAFVGAYSGALQPLRHLAGQSGAKFAAAMQRKRPINSFADFYRDVGPAILLHGQGLMVAVVSAGVVNGAVDGYLAQQQAVVQSAGASRGPQKPA